MRCLCALQTMRANIGALKPYLRVNDQIVVSAFKGLELGSKYRMTQVIVEELGGGWDLGGGAVGAEPCQGDRAGPSRNDCGGGHGYAGRPSPSWQLLTGGRFRVYTNPDVVGVSWRARSRTSSRSPRGWRTV